MTLFGFCPQCHRCDDMERFPKCTRCKKRPLLVSPSDTFFREIFVEGKRPTQAELLELQSYEFAPAQMSEVERKVAKKKLGMGWILGLTALVLGPILFAFLGAISLRGLAWICLAGLLLYGIFSPVAATVAYLHNKTFGGKQKTPRDAFVHYWFCSIFIRNNEKETEFESSEFAAASALRHVPEGYRTGFDPSAISAYADGLRNAVQQILKEQAQMARSAYEVHHYWVEYDIFPSFKEKDIPKPTRESSVYELNLNIELVFRAFQTNHSTYEKMVINLAKVMVHVRQTCIRNGEYWFMYDLAPAFTVAAARQESGPDKRIPEQPTRKCERRR
ncbi:MAG: lysine exporter LysO family protein [Firmicutes bacterium]|nr:lysine exporter LysO family protein [Bacillota bacterium]